MVFLFSEENQGIRLGNLRIRRKIVCFSVEYAGRESEIYRMDKERIQKILSERGVCSRRKAEALLAEGKIKVNGKVVDEPGFKCTREDEIELDGQKVSPQEKSAPVYLRRNKPYDVVSTSSDPEGRRTILDFVPKKYGRVFSIGRLDHNSTGLLLLTNDGEFANLMTHPSSAPEKEYLVQCKNPYQGDEIEKRAKGIYIPQDAYKTKPCEAKLVRSLDSSCVFSLVLHEGKKREIRHRRETRNHPVTVLRRIRIGDILLGKRKPGEVKEIPSELVKQRREECLLRKKDNQLSGDANEDDDQ